MVINHFPELILHFVEFFEIDRCMYQKQVKHNNPKILEEKKICTEDYKLTNEKKIFNQTVKERESQFQQQIIK